MLSMVECVLAVSKGMKNTKKRMQKEIASAFAETTQHWASQDQELRTNWINYAIQK